MKNLFFTFILFFQASLCFSQHSDSIPNGVYLTWEQFKQGKPASNPDLIVSKRSSGDIFMKGGNDFKVKSTSDSISKKFIAKEIFAYVKNDSIFLNCARLKNHLPGYTYCAGGKGRYVPFQAAMTKQKSFTMAMIGGALASGLSAKSRYWYVLDTETGEPVSLDKKNLKKMLKDKPELLEQFEASKEKDTDEGLLHFVSLLNGGE